MATNAARLQIPRWAEASAFLGTLERDQAVAACYAMIDVLTFYRYRGADFYAIDMGREEWRDPSTLTHYLYGYCHAVGDCHTWRNG